MAGRLYIIAGQSNAVGGGDVLELSDSVIHFAKPDARIRHAYRINCTTFGSPALCPSVPDWGSLAPHPPASNPVGPNRFLGMEMSVGPTLVAGHPGDNIAIIVHATNGTDLKADWDPNAVSGLRLYSRMVSDVTTLAAAEGVTVAGMFWCQANGDALNEADAVAYEARLTAFIAKCRTDFGVPNMPFVFDQLSPLNTADAALATMRAVQARVGRNVPNCACVPTEGLALRDEIQHYSSDAFVTLGWRMGAAMLRLESGNGYYPPMPSQASGWFRYRLPRGLHEPPTVTY